MYIIEFYIIGAIYFQLANLDPVVRPRLESVNLVALYNTNLFDH